MLQYQFSEKGIKEARRNFRKLYTAVQQGRVKAMEAGGKKAVEIIRKRTTSGKDVNHRKFKKYSKAYAKWKGTSFVDLELRGVMLNAVSLNAWAKKCRIFIKGTGELIKKAIVHNNGGRSGRGTGFAMPKREFMGVEKERDEVIKPIREWWYKFAKKLGFGR
jgi:phage gpG-like protein